MISDATSGHLGLGKRPTSQCLHSNSVLFISKKLYHLLHFATPFFSQDFELPQDIVQLRPQGRPYGDSKCHPII